MCVKPISVPNPLYRRSGYGSQFGKIVKLDKCLSPQTEYITVPCGKCAECRDTYFNSLLQRAICEARSSYMYFVTLTYDDKHIPYIDLDHDRILYADYHHFQNLIKRLRNQKVLDRDFRYLVVNEYGDTYSRPHFHALFFVAKKKDDDGLTPHRIERALHDHVKPNFSINLGTRKNPQYECLFTHCERCTPFGLRTNYWVKLVESDQVDYLKSEDDSGMIRAIRYLIGYVNTSQSIDNSISEFLHRHINDQDLCTKVKRVLANRVRFSKGFGCGFVDGEKFYLPRISCRASSNVLTYSELVQNFPSTFDEFDECYPQLAENVLEWLRIDRYSDYDSLDECLKSFSCDDFLLHALTVRYFPKHLSNHLRTLYKKPYVPTISSFFHQNNKYSYGIKKVVTCEPDNSDLYKFLRSGVEDGLRAGVPFITFPIRSQQGYVSLCKYYRDRVCTFDDTIRMFHACGVSSYDEWLKLFVESFNTRKRDKSVGNLQKNAEKKEICFANQKKSVYLRRRTYKNPYIL